MQQFPISHTIPPGTSTPTLLNYAEGKLFIFDSQNEFEEYLAQKENIWAPEAYLKSIETEIEEFLDNTAVAHWYSDYNNVASCNVIGGDYYTEASQILIWGSSVWKAFEIYRTTVTEENALSVADYIASIPPLSL